MSTHSFPNPDAPAIKRAKRLIARYHKAFDRMYDAKYEALLYNPRYEPRERIAANRRRTLARIEAQLMEALTS